MQSEKTYISEKVRNASNVVINPATEWKQDSQNSTAESIRELVSMLSFLPSVRWVAADLRVTLLSGTVTAVTTLSNQTSIGWYVASWVVPAQTNQNAILSNINNITR